MTKRVRQSSATAEILNLRAVQPSDKKILWEWSNRPQTRRYSFNSKPISWAEHVKWFASKMRDRRCYFYVAENCGNRPVGQIRFERKGEVAIVSLMVDKKYQGRGYASEMLTLSSKKLFKNNIKKILAYVLPQNYISLEFFKKNGFKKSGFIFVNKKSAYKLELRRKR